MGVITDIFSYSRLTSRTQRVWSALAPFARRHRRWLAHGVFASFVVVGLRLSLPWPFRLLIDRLLPAEGFVSEGLPLAWIGSGVQAAIFMGLVFLVLLVSLGYADLVARVNFARFAIGWVKDLRAEIFSAIFHGGTRSRSTRYGDLVARLVGDTARIKAGLQGFLVHVATNGIMFVGVVVILVWLDFAMGMIFLLAGLAVSSAAVFGSSRILRRALKQRKKEGKLAGLIQQASGDFLDRRLARVNKSSGFHEASVTRLQGVVTLFAHIILGLAVVAALWMGARGISAGRLRASDLFILFAYTLMLRAPMVQLARQGGRTGKIIASGDRLARLVDLSHAVRQTNTILPPLEDRLRVVGVKVSGGKVKPQGRRRRLGRIDLEIPAGQRLAIVGGSGSGKSTLLDLIGGYQKPRRGKVLWDGVDQQTIPAFRLAEQVAYLFDDPKWARRPIRALLDLPREGASEKARGLLVACGAQAVLDDLPAGLESRVGSDDLSYSERKALGLARVMLSKASVWLLDDPTGTLSEGDANRLIGAILEAANRATLIVTFGRPIAIQHFERVIELARGRVVFDGPPEAWLERLRGVAEGELTFVSAEKEERSARRRAL